MTNTGPSWLRTLIKAYLRSARFLAGRLEKEYGVPNLLAGRRSRAVPRTGKLADGTEFRFHGAGCWMTDGNTIVDVDFGPNGEVDIFDSWRLHVYSEDQPELVGAHTCAEVSEALDLLLWEKEVVQVEGSNRFRLP